MIMLACDVCMTCGVPYVHPLDDNGKHKFIIATEGTCDLRFFSFARLSYSMENP